MAAQTVTAVDNARLYRHAVEDLYTGAYVKEYFRRRAVQAVDEAHRQGRTLALIGLRLLDEARLQEALGAEGYGRYLERFCRIVRRQLPEATLCRSAEGAFEALLLGVAPEDVAARLQGLSRAVAAADLGPLTADQLAIVDAFYNDICEKRQGFCTSCGYCAPCPQGINIAQRLDEAKQLLSV